MLMPRLNQATQRPRPCTSSLGDVAGKKCPLKSVSNSSADCNRRRKAHSFAGLLCVWLCVWLCAPANVCALRVGCQMMPSPSNIAKINSMVATTYCTVLMVIFFRNLFPINAPVNAESVAAIIRGKLNLSPIFIICFE